MKNIIITLVEMDIAVQSKRQFKTDSRQIDNGMLYALCSHTPKGTYMVNVSNVEHININIHVALWGWDFDETIGNE